MPKSRVTQIVEDLRRERQELAKRTIGAIRSFDNSLTPFQTKAKEMALILNCNGWHIDNDSDFATWTIYGHPSLHVRLIEVMTELILEAGCWKNIVVLHPTIHSYGAAKRSIKHEIDFIAEYIPDHSD